MTLISSAKILILVVATITLLFFVETGIRKFSQNDVIKVEKEVVEVFSVEQTSKVGATTPTPVVTPAVVTPRPPVVIPVPTPVPTPVPVPVPIPVPPPIVYDEANIPAIANTVLAVEMIPLLSGGTALAGVSVPISYLQIANVGSEPAYLKGFWIKQNGDDVALSIIGLTTVDDRGGSRGYAGGVENSTPFTNNLAYAPIAGKMFAPGEMRLFTIKASFTKNISTYVGKQIRLEVIGIDTNAQVQGSFPIRGTTWTIGY